MKLKFKQKPNKVIIKSRNLRLLHKKYFQEHLRNNLLGVEFESMPLCFYINAYNSKLQNSLDEIAPVTKKEVNFRPNQPWFNAEVRTLKRKKRQTERKYKKDQNDCNYKKYGKQKSIYYSNLKQTRINYYLQVLQFNENNSKVIYNTIKKLTGDMQQKIFPSGYTAKKLVKLFSKHFFDKIVTFRSLINSKSDESHLRENKVKSSIKFEQMNSFLPVSIKELQHLISSMNNKSSLLDPSPVGLIKECSDIIFPFYS